MAQVNMPNTPPREDALTTLMKGLTIASQIYGIRSDMAKLDQYAEQKADKERMAQGNFNKDELLKIGQNYQLSPSKPEGDSIQIGSTANPDTPLYATPFKQPVPDKIARVDTVDANGNPVTKFVNPQAGATYASPKTASNSASGKTISATEASQLGSFEGAIKIADDLKNKYNNMASQTGSSIASLIPGSAANRFNKDRYASAQAIGTILEQGKLSDRDFEKYYNMTPAPTDTNSVAAEKTAALKNLITLKKQGAIEGLKNSGYDTSGFNQDAIVNNNAVPQNPSGEAFAVPKPTPTPDDLAAMNWLKNNPNDKNAPQVRATLKAKGF